MSVRTDPAIRTELCEEARLYLIAPRPSGVLYSAQAGGVVCEHPAIEGAILAVATGEAGVARIADVMCDTGCWGRASWPPDDVAQADAALAAVAWDGFTRVERMRLDRTRLAESVEGWWWVTFTLSNDPRELRGVVCGPNCD